MKRRKFSKCFVAMLLVIVMGITAVPMTVLNVVADEVKDVVENIEIDTPYVPTDKVENRDLIDSKELENAYIIDENIDGRTFNSKEFIMSDGTIMVQQFVQNIHYADEDGLKEIDNTLVEVVDEKGETTYENSANFYKVKMSKNFKPNKEFLELKNGEYHLTFTFVDDSAKNATAKNDDEVKEKSNNKYKDKKLKNPKPYSTGEGKVSYTNIAKDVDLEYEAKDNGIKENIIVNNYLSDYDFDFKIKVKNLILQENLDGSISAINEEGEEKYVIPAPFMFDANGEYNYEVEYVLTEVKDGYTLTISADEEWIETKASLPVTIDPIIETLNDNGYEFRNVYQSGTVSTSGSEVYVGEKDSGNKSNAYIRFKLGPDATHTLVGASLTYHHKTAGMALLRKETINYTINVVDSEKLFSEVTYTSKPTKMQQLGTFLAENVRTSAEATTTYSINPHTIKGDFLTISYEVGTSNTSQGYAKIFTSGTNAPYLTLRYKRIMGVDDSYSMETNEIDGATAYVNKATGLLTLNLDVASINNLGMPMTASLVYNSFYNEVLSDFAIPKTFGNDFKVNFQQYVRAGTDNSIILTDADGSITVMNYENSAYRSRDKLLSAEGSVSGELIVYDAGLNARKFANGRLVEIYNLESTINQSTNYERIVINYVQSSGTLTDKILNASYYAEGETSASYKIGFTYSSDLVTGITTYKGTQSLQSYRLEYDESNNLVKIRNTKASMDMFRMEFDAYEGYLEAVFNRKNEGLYFVREPYDDRVWRVCKLLGTESYTARWFDYVEFDYDSIPSVTEVSYVQNEKCVSRSYVCYDALLNIISEWDENSNGEIQGSNKGYYTYNYSSSATIYDYTRVSNSFAIESGSTIYGPINLSSGQSSTVAVTKDDHIVSNSYHKYGLTFLVESQYDIDLTVTDGLYSKRIVLKYGGKLYVTMQCSYYASRNFTFKNNGSVNSTKISNINYGYIGYYCETFKNCPSPSVKQVYAITGIVNYTRQGVYQTKTYDGKQRLTKEEVVSVDDPTTETTTYTYTQPASGVSSNYWLGKVSYEEMKRGGAIISSTTYNYVDNSSIESVEAITSKQSAGKKRTFEQITKGSDGYTIIQTAKNGVQTIQTYAVMNGDIRLKRTESEGVIEEYEYNYFGDVTKIKILDSNGTTILSSTSDGSGVYAFGEQTFTSTYNDYGYITDIEHGNTTMLHYDYEDEDRFNYYDDLTRKTYANGQIEEYDYANDYYSVTYKKSNTSSESEVFTYNYYAGTNQVNSSSYSKNGVQQLSYDYGDISSKTQNNLSISGNLSYNALLSINKDEKYNIITSTNDTFSKGGTDTVYTTSYTYNDKKQLTANALGSYNSSITYDRLDRIQGYSAKNGSIVIVNETYNYDTYTYNGVTYVTDRILSITDNLDGSSITNNTYNTNGLISSISYNGKTYNYTYDEANRLKTETIDGTIVTYAYDSYNSITSVSGGSYGASYAYDDYGRLSTFTSGGSTKYFTYDAMGNPTLYKGSSTDASANMTWTQGRKLESYTVNGNTYSYSYDMNGVRYKKVNGDNVTEYYLDGSTIIAENRKVGTTDNLIYYIYDSMGLSGMVYNQQNYYYVKNTLGDIIGIRNSSGTTVATYTYDAWGNILSMSGSMAEVNPFRYRGYYYDTESGFYYLQTRYYDPTIRQFINADNYELLSTLSQSIGELNLYQYCGNNPIMRIDPTGEEWWHWVIGVGIILVCAALTVVTAGGFAAAGTAFASVLTATMAPTAASAFFAGATIGAMALGTVGMVLGGMSGADGWSWEKASQGFMSGSIAGAAVGGAWGATHYALQNAGRMAIRTSIKNLLNNPFDEYVTIGPKDGAISEYVQSISQSGDYGQIFASKLGKDVYQIANGHHRIAALKLLGYKFVKFYLVP